MVYPFPIDISSQAYTDGSRNIMGWRECKSQRIRISDRKQCPLYVTGSRNHEILIIWLYKQDMNNDNTS